MAHLVSAQRPNRRADDSFELDDKRKRELVSREVDEFERAHNQAGPGGREWTAQSSTAESGVRTARRRRLDAAIRINHGVHLMWRGSATSDL